METQRRTVGVEEAGRILGISRGSAYELARRGELPGVIRLGRRLVVSTAALEKLLAETGGGAESGEASQT